MPLTILPQPDEMTCGPTCLHSVYRYYGNSITLEEVITQTRSLEGGGTLAVFLACHALRMGYRATIYTYNLQVFDPTWFLDGGSSLAAKLRQRATYKKDPMLTAATGGYLEFLERGGRIRFEDLTPGLIRRYLRKGRPILTGLSATYLYRSAREFGANLDYDDIRGEPSGHFVILSGYEQADRQVLIADPLQTNPVGEGCYYRVPIDRVIGSILLGILTYDANLLIIEPGRGHGRIDRR